MADIVEPQADRIGLKVRSDAWDGDYSALSTRIERDINTWDLVHVEAIYVLNTKMEKLFFADPSRDLTYLSPSLKDDPTLGQPLKQGYAVPILEYGYVIAGRQSRINRNIEQLTWKDFWDTAAIPGHRGLRNFPVGNIEAALASEGYDPIKYLYQETDPSRLRSKVSEALHRIGQLKSDVVWWKTGEALQQGVESGDMPLAAAWSGRLWSSFKAVCPKAKELEECDIRANPRTSFISTDWWIIPANARNKDAASHLLQAVVSKDAVDGARKFSMHEGYSVPLVGANVTDKIADYFMRLGSSENSNKAARIDEKFWGVNFDWINREWADFRARS
jgi:putative spermidine/putrescine transport system substrate-binding protein